jgi:hypothetical protein
MNVTVSNRVQERSLRRNLATEGFVQSMLARCHLSMTAFELKLNVMIMVLPCHAVELVLLTPGSD